MADSREIGMRVGAATNQAVSVVAADPSAFAHNPDAIVAFVEDLAGKLLGVMDRLQQAVAGTPQVSYTPPVQQVPVQQNATVTGYAPQPQPQVPFAQGAQAAVQAFGGTVIDETAFSGNTKPMKLAEHPELPAWLHAQAAAVGVTEVWDNRGKPNYIAAIQSGSPKTPAPFRSATQGIDKAFWPPRG